MDSIKDFDAIYVQNLPCRTDRLLEFEKELMIHCDIKADVIHGARAIHPYIGNNIGKLEMFKRAKTAGLKNFLAFEDDARPLKDARKHVDSALADLPADWDVLFLGYWMTRRESFCKIDGKWITDPPPKIQNDFNYQKKNHHYKRAGENLVRITGGYVNMTHALAFNGHIFDECIAYLEKVSTEEHYNRTKEILFLQELFIDWQEDSDRHVFLVAPMAFKQCQDHSDVLDDLMPAEFANCHENKTYKSMLKYLEI